MSGVPADVPEPDEDAVRALLRAVPRAHVPDPATVGLRFVARGWDNAVWRVGEHLTVRIPLREQAVPLLLNEARWAAEVARPFLRHGAAVALPVHLAPVGPEHHWPYPWMVCRWVEGDLLEDVAVDGRDFLVGAFAAALPDLHRPSPPEAPVSPFRGLDLADLPELRADVLPLSRARLGEGFEPVWAAYEQGRRAPRWERPRVWCHGDLHPRNLLRRSPAAPGAAGGLGVLDHGDLTSGDPATDLGVLWLALDADQRAQVLDAVAETYDDATLVRARAWAARFVLAVSGVYPEPFERTLVHATAQVTLD